MPRERVIVAADAMHANNVSSTHMRRRPTSRTVVVHHHQQVVVIIVHHQQQVISRPASSTHVLCYTADADDEGWQQ